jgi:hypothetical protein
MIAMEQSSPSRPKNPRRVAAGKLNVLKRKGLSPEGRERVRIAALAHEPWRFATGPRTPEGKARSAANGKARQKGDKSVRELRAERAQYLDLIRQMAASRRILAEMIAPHPNAGG